MLGIDRVITPWLVRNELRREAQQRKQEKSVGRVPIGKFRRIIIEALTASIVVSPFLPTPVWASDTGHKAGQPAQGSPEAGDLTSEMTPEIDLESMRYKQVRWEEWEAVVPGPYAQSPEYDKEAGRGYSVDQDDKMRTANASILSDPEPKRIMIGVGEYKIGPDGNLPKKPDNSQFKIVDFSSVLKELQTIVRVLATDTYALPLTFCATDGESASGPECDGISTGTTVLIKLSDSTTKLAMIENGEIRGFIDVPDNIKIIDVIGLNSNDGSVLVHVQDNQGQKDMLYIFSSSFPGSPAEKFRLFRPEGWSGNPVRIEVINHDSKSVIVVVDPTAGTVSYYQSDNGNFKLIRTARPNNLGDLQYEAQGNMLAIMEVVPGQNFFIVNFARLNQNGSMERTEGGKYVFAPVGLGPLRDVRLLGSVNPEGNVMIVYISAKVGEEPGPVLLACAFDAAQIGGNAVWKVLGPYDGESPDQLNSTVIIPRPQGPATLANQVGVSEPRNMLFMPTVGNINQRYSHVLGRKDGPRIDVGGGRGEKKFSKGQSVAAKPWIV